MASPQASLSKIRALVDTRVGFQILCHLSSVTVHLLKLLVSKLPVADPHFVSGLT